MNIIGIIILGAIIGSFILHLYADLLNMRSLQLKVPEEFNEVYDADRYKTSQSYLRMNTWFDWIAGTAYLLLFLCIWFCKGFMMLDDWARSIMDSPIVCGLLYIGILFFGKAIVSIPFSIYSTFVIEEKFGFNKTTAKLFMADQAKKFALSVVLGGCLLTAVLAFFEYAGAWAWLYCWALIIVFMIIMQFIAPTWIMPLFNKFKPLEEGELRAAIVAYARKIDFPLENVFVMDGSKRSVKSNAFFTGFGRHKRIVLFDTLINGHGIPEVLAILAHEIGHYKMRHIFWMMFAGMIQAGVMLYLLSLFISSPSLFEAFYVNQPSVYAGFVFFSFLYSPIDFFLSVLLQALSRKNEYSADRFAVETTCDSQSFITALKKLAAHNLSNLTPHPFYVYINYSHPPVLERIKAIK
ncbi:MAG: M48 family metallopeptidase [Desulfobacterales bacterium]|jgi:STE24 endopeptidase|nr:M48 family metallopeptidase [Desulfobacterales bacterium]